MLELVNCRCDGIFHLSPHLEKICLLLGEASHPISALVPTEKFQLAAVVGVNGENCMVLSMTMYLLCSSLSLNEY